MAVVIEIDVEELLKAPTEWPFANSNFKETAKWPFDRTEEESGLTGWFPVTINPVRIGVYEILTKESINWPHPNKGLWDGKKWNFLDHTVEEWRGLAKDPNA